MPPELNPQRDRATPAGVGGRTERASLAEDDPPSRPGRADPLEPVALVERLRACEEAALQELYDRYSPVIYGVALRMLGEPADAEELVVDVLVKAWSSIESFDATRGTLECWLLLMTRSRAMDHLRRRRRRQAAMDEAQAGGDLLADTNGGRPAPTADQLDRRRELTALLDVLPDKQRRAIELAYFGGMTQREIAVEVDAPLGTVKTRMRTAMKRLSDAHGNGHSNGGEGA